MINIKNKKTLIIFFSIITIIVVLLIIQNIIETSNKPTDPVSIALDDYANSWPEEPPYKIITSFSLEDSYICIYLSENNKLATALICKNNSWLNDNKYVVESVVSASADQFDKTGLIYEILGETPSKSTVIINYWYNPIQDFVYVNNQKINLNSYDLEIEKKTYKIGFLCTTIPANTDVDNVKITLTDAKEE